MKRNLLTGLAILLPIAITIAIFIYLFNLITNPFTGLMKSLLQDFIYSDSFLVEHYKITNIILKILSLIILIGLIWILGFSAQRLVVKWVIKLIQKIFARIPLIRWIYDVTRDTTSSFLKGQKKMFSRTVLLPFPYPKARALGLVAGPAPTAMTSRIITSSGSMQAVFVPTAPHPISGFILMIDEAELKDVDLSPEDLFKFLISCGTLDLNDPNAKNDQ